MRKSNFNKFLQSLDEEELRKELMQLFTKSKDVKAYYQMELGTEKERKAIYDKYKKNIKSKYATRSYRRPKRPRIMKIKAIFREAEKISVFKEELADLYLYNVEQGLDFMEDYYYYNEVLINHMVQSFEKGVALLREAQLIQGEEKTRIEKIIVIADHLLDPLADKFREIVRN